MITVYCSSAGHPVSTRNATILRLKKKGVVKMANRPWLNKRLSKTHREAISAGLKRFNAEKEWRENCKIDPMIVNRQKLDLNNFMKGFGFKTATDIELNLKHFHENNKNLRLAIHCLETALELLKCKI